MPPARAPVSPEAFPGPFHHVQCLLRAGIGKTLNVPDTTAKSQITQTGSFDIVSFNTMFTFNIIPVRHFLRAEDSDGGGCRILGR